MLRLALSGTTWKAGDAADDTGGTAASMGLPAVDGSGATIEGCRFPNSSTSCSDGGDRETRVEVAGSARVDTGGGGTCAVEDCGFTWVAGTADFWVRLLVTMGCGLGLAEESLCPGAGVGMRDRAGVSMVALDDGCDTVGIDTDVTGCSKEGLSWDACLCGEAWGTCDWC